MSDDLDFRIAKLELERGDVLVIRTERPITQSAAEHFRQALRPILPDGVKAMFLEPGTELSVLTAKDIESRTDTAG